MKTILLPLLLCLLTALSSCENKEKISYPEEGNYGENILKMDADTIQGTRYSSSNSPFHYSMFAELEEDAHLEIVMEKEVGPGAAYWSYESGSRAGWIIVGSGSATRFIAYGPIVCDMEVTFWESGSATLEFYENHSEEPVRIKTLVWDY